MPRKISLSQFKSKLRQAQSQRRRAINNVNSAIRKYNQAVRTYNSKVRADQQRINNALSRLQRRSVSTSYAVYQQSTIRLNSSYTRLEEVVAGQEIDSHYELLVDLSARESANSLEVLDRFTDGIIDSHEVSDNLQTTVITHELRQVSEDLDDRWRGAIFSLQPKNPDAARHFCASAREIFTQILEIQAPDDMVIQLLPHCERTQKGNPTRRSKVKYLLYKRGYVESALEEFVENDIQNIVELFNLFNSGTHGPSGTFDFSTLASIKKRTEDGIIFLSKVMG
jgi:hypothetical protein